MTAVTDLIRVASDIVENWRHWAHLLGNLTFLRLASYFLVKKTCVCSNMFDASGRSGVVENEAVEHAL